MVWAAVLALLPLASCRKNPAVPGEVRPARTVLVYMAVDNDLSGETAGKREALRQGRISFSGGELLVYEDSKSGARLLRIAPDGNIGSVAEYGSENSASPAVFGRVLRDVMARYPAGSYGLIFFSHGSGWLPAGRLQNPSRASLSGQGEPVRAASSAQGTRSLGWDDGAGEEMPDGAAHAEMELSEFAAAIPDGTLDFIVFESCLMAGVEVAYALRDKTGYMLASSAEIVSPGFTPVYPSALRYLFDTSRGVEESLAAFGAAYMSHVDRLPGDYRSATLSLVAMQEMDLLAARTRELLAGFTHRPDIISGLQYFDRPGSYGDSPAVARYFDLGEWARRIGTQERYAVFGEQLERTVVWKAHTERFLPSQNGFGIRNHSGLTTYAERPELPALNGYYRMTAWYRAVYGI